MEDENIVHDRRGGVVRGVLILVVVGPVDREAEIHEGCRVLNVVGDDEVHVHRGA